MASYVWLTLLLAVNLLASEPENQADYSDHEAELPEYLRGIGWNAVEDLLQDDLRIGNAITPSHYILDLAVDVRRYNGAVKSAFFGKVAIDLNITKPVRGIELHAVGLDIREASITYLDNTILRTTGGRLNSLRETVTLFENKEFEPREARLIISFYGTSYRNRYGLFETWSRMDGESPRIALTTFTSPTGARYWFPSFDEPDKKATFQLTLSHPSALNAYSNTRVLSSMAAFHHRTRTVFAETPLLPTYMLAMSLNDLPFESITYMNHTVRAFGPGSYIAVIQARNALDKLWNDWRFKGLSFLAEKTDIFIFEDIDMALEYPGMILLPVGTVENMKYVIEHEFVHMYFGNLVTPKTFDNAWIIEGYSTLIAGLNTIDWAKPSAPGFSSLHEPPVHENRRFVNSISSSIHITDPYITYVKSAQILNYVSQHNKLVFWEYTKELLMNHEFGNVNEEFLIEEISGKSEYILSTLSLLINQPGKVLVVVKKVNDTLHFETIRYHSSFFHETLRDSNATILSPVFLSVYGLNRPVFISGDTTYDNPENTPFFLVNDDLWTVTELIYEAPAPDAKAAVRSMLAAVEIGYFTFDKLVGNIRTNLHLFNGKSFDELSSDLRYFFFPKPIRTGFTRNCTERKMSKLLLDYENKALEETRRLFSLSDSLIESLLCGFSNTSEYEKFLHRTFIENDPIVRGRDLISLLMSAEMEDFPGVFADFFFDVYVKNPNPFLRHELLRIIDALFVDLSMTDKQNDQLRDFVRTNTELAASLAEKVAVALEKHYVVKKRREFYNITEAQFDAAFEQLRIELIGIE